VGHVEDRWFNTISVPGGKSRRERTSRYGKGMRYRVRYITPDGRELSKSFPDRAKGDAEAFLASVETDKRRGTFLDPAGALTPFDEHAERWLRIHRVKASSRETAEIRVRTHIIPFFKKRALGSIKPSMVTEWDNGLIGVLDVSTRSVAFSFLSSIFTLAVDDGLIAKNPCSAKSVTQPQPVPRKVVPWTMKRTAAVRAALPARYRPMVDLGVGCGLRQGEIFGIAPEDFDFDAGWLTVQRQVKRVRSRLVFDLPKNDKDRQTPLPDSVAKAIKAHMKAIPPVPVTLPWEDPFTGEPVSVPLVFTTFRGNAINRSTFDDLAWRPALLAVGVVPTRQTGMHALRHRFASSLLDAGETIKAIAEWLGHSDPGFTLRTYTHLMETSQGRARDAIDSLFDGPDGWHGPATAQREE